MSMPESPYQSPQETGVAPGGSAPPSGAVTAVAIVNYILGGLQLLCGACFVLGGGVGASFIGAAAANNPDIEGPDAAAAAGMFGGLFLVAGVIVIILGVPMLLAGYGVQKRRQWGRILTLILGGLSALFGVFNLVTLNPGVIVNAGYAIFVFVILLNSRYAAEFS
jgi:hypothetical protein